MPKYAEPESSQELRDTIRRIIAQSGLTEAEASRRLGYPAPSQLNRRLNEGKPAFSREDIENVCATFKLNEEQRIKLLRLRGDVVVVQPKQNIQPVNSTRYLERLRHWMPDWFQRIPDANHVISQERMTRLQSLVDALLRCPTASDLDWAEYHHILDLLLALHSHDREYFELNVVYQQLDEIVPLTFQWSRTVLLCDRLLMIDLEDAILSKLYNFSWPTASPRRLLGEHIRDRLIYAVYLLASTEIDRIHHEQPLVKFVREVLRTYPHLLPHEQRDDLTQWTDAEAHRLHLATPMPTAEQAAEPSTLLIQVIPAQRQGPRYARVYEFDSPEKLQDPHKVWLFVSAWLIHHDQPSHPIRLIPSTDDMASADQQPNYTLHELREGFAELIELATHNNETSPLTIELLLPLHLLLYDVEYWGMFANPFNRAARKRIGWTHPVIVHALSRYYGPHQRILAANYWQRLAQFKGCTAPNKGIGWLLRQDDCVGDRLQGELDNAATFPVMLVQAVPSESVEQRYDILGQALYSGLPTALIVRRSGMSPQQVQEELHPQLQPNALDRLGHTVLLCRQKATGVGEGHYGHHLTLLWDDLSRQPPDNLLMQPE